MDWDELARFKAGFDLSTPEAAMEFTQRFLGPPQSGMKWLARGVRDRMERRGPRSLLDSVTPEVLLDPHEVRSLRPPTLIMWGDEEADVALGRGQVAHGAVVV